MDAEDAIGVLQHHDALPGTMNSKTTKLKLSCRIKRNCLVYEDYMSRLGNAQKGLDETLKITIEKIMNNPKTIGFEPYSETVNVDVDKSPL